MRELTEWMLATSKVCGEVIELLSELSDNNVYFPKEGTYLIMKINGEDIKIRSVWLKSNDISCLSDMIVLMSDDNTMYPLSSLSVNSFQRVISKLLAYLNFEATMRRQKKLYREVAKFNNEDVLIIDWNAIKSSERDLLPFLVEKPTMECKSTFGEVKDALCDIYSWLENRLKKIDEVQSDKKLLPLLDEYVYLMTDKFREYIIRRDGEDYGQVMANHLIVIPVSKADEYNDSWREMAAEKDYDYYVIKGVTGSVTVNGNFIEINSEGCGITQLSNDKDNARIEFSAMINKFNYGKPIIRSNYEKESKGVSEIRFDGFERFVKTMLPYVTFDQYRHLFDTCVYECSNELEGCGGESKKKMKFLIADLWTFYEEAVKMGLL